VSSLRKSWKVKVWLVLFLPVVVSAACVIWFLKGRFVAEESWYVSLPKTYSEIIALSQNYETLKKLLLKAKSSEKGKELRIVYNPFFESSGKTSGKGSKKGVPQTSFNRFRRALHLELILKNPTKHQKVCVINGKFYQEGSVVKKGIKILKIGDYYVEVRIGKKVVRIKVGDSYYF